MRGLQADLDRAFSAPELDRGLFAALVQSLDGGRVLYRLNASKLVMPASNMKVLTLAASAERLGWDFAYETRLVSSAPVESGTLKGDLIVIGSGDPTIDGRQGSPTRVFEDWADRLREAGITEIGGRLVGDDRAFDPGDARGRVGVRTTLVMAIPPRSALYRYHENVVDVVIGPGPGPGEPASVALSPSESGMLVDNRAVTVNGSMPPTLGLRRLPGSRHLELIGTVPSGAPETTRTASVEGPTAYLVRTLRAVLRSKGIDVQGEAVGVNTLIEPPDLSAARVLVSHRSAPLSEIAKVLMKVSQNLYAETLLKTLGAGRADAGHQAVREVIGSWGIPSESVVLVDGSGLSRYNLVTAETLVAVLRHMYDDPRHQTAFLDTLPIAGRDGSLANRMAGTLAENNARAKTGSIANVRALSGYVRTLDGEMLAFSIIANNFNVPQDEIDRVTDQVVERLANFSQK